MSIPADLSMRYAIYTFEKQYTRWGAVSQETLYQCSYGRANAHVGGQNLLTSDVIYQQGVIVDVLPLPGVYQIYIVFCLSDCLLALNIIKGSRKRFYKF